MDDFALMHIVKCTANLLHDDFGHFFIEFPLLLEQGVQLPRGAELLNQVDVFLIGKEGIELHDVGVVQKRLDLYLPNQLH